MASKDIVIEEAQNGYIINVTYYQQIDDLDDFVKLEKKWIAIDDNQKDEVLKNLK
jgi:hypothetical protein